MYNTKSQEEYFFDKNSTILIKELIFGHYKNNPSIAKIKKSLIEKELLTSDIVAVKHKKKNSLNSPLRVSINISRKCNLRCKHCLSDSGNKDSDELTTKELFNLIDQMQKSGSFYLAIGGGEPLFRDDIFKVIEYARKNFIAVSIITNALLIDEELAKKLSSLDLVTITISIDGTEKHHDHIRGKGNFKKAIENIKILRKYCKKTKIAMRVTINRLNQNDFSELIKLAEKLKLDFIRFSPTLLFGRAKENQDLLLTQEEYIQFIKNANKIKSKIRVILSDKRNEKSLLIDNDGFGCHCGKEICWISQAGDFYPCVFFGEDYKVGNIKKENFLSLWEKSKNMVKLCGNETCNSCGNLKNCGGGCRSRALNLNNDINGVDPYCILKRNK